MSITLDDKAVDVFKLYDEMTIAYSKDIEGYKAHIVAIEAMIAQKQRMLRDIKEKTVKLLNTSTDLSSSVIVMLNIPYVLLLSQAPYRKFR